VTPQPTWADLEDAFHDTSLGRGLRYAREGRVCGVRSEASGAKRARLHASVQGTEPAPYEVTVTIEASGGEPLIDGRCTCPVGYNCKHAAAVLIAAYALQPRARQIPDAPASLAAPETANRAPARLPTADSAFTHAYWIERVRALYAPAAPPPVRKQRLAYAIEREPYRGRPVVRPMIGNVRKDGTLGSMRFSPDDVATILRNRPQYVGDEDEPLLRALALASDSGAHGKVLTRDAALLRRIVTLGLAVAKRSENWNDYVPLRIGEPRAATAHWVADAQGRQRFAFRAEPAAEVLALEGLWYLDRAHGEFGELKTDVDAALVAELLAAPPIAPAEAAAVARELAAALPPAIAHLPLPAPIETRTVQTRGVVHLRLANGTALSVSRYSSESVEGAALFVHVRYGQVPVRLDDDGRARMHEGALVAPIVDRALHVKTLNRLHSAGCMDMPDAPGQAPHESAFFLHESLVLRLMHESLPRWRKAGWVIEIEPDFAWQTVPAGTFFVATEPQADDRWFGLELGVEVDGQRVSLQPLLAHLLPDRQLRDGLLAEDGRDTDTVNVRIDARRAHLARRIRPFILRRTKEMVARELPPKTEIEQTVELTGAQRDLYETVRAAMHERVREALARQGLARSHIVVLDALLKLRQVCCDPRLVRNDAAKKVRESAKLERLRELLPELVAEGRRVPLFSQFTSMLALIEQAVTALGIAYVKLTGDTRGRATPVARFQARRSAAVSDQPESGRHRAESDRGRHGDPLRPVVEPGSRRPGHRPRASHRPGQAGVRAQVDRGGDRRGAHPRTSGAQGGAGARHPRPGRCAGKGADRGRSAGAARAAARVRSAA
jgi:hypothetical protein